MKLFRVEALLEKVDDASRRVIVAATFADERLAAMYQVAYVSTVPSDMAATCQMVELPEGVGRVGIEFSTAPTPEAAMSLCLVIRSIELAHSIGIGPDEFKAIHANIVAREATEGGGR